MSRQKDSTPSPALTTTHHRRALSKPQDFDNTKHMAAVAEENEENLSPTPDGAPEGNAPAALAEDATSLMRNASPSPFPGQGDMLMFRGTMPEVQSGFGYQSVYPRMTLSAAPPAPRRTTLYTVTVGENPNEADFYVDNVSAVHAALVSLAKGGP
ncbi:unnamed protein product, partial [Symbiodinium sp. KB8]